MSFGNIYPAEDYFLTDQSRFVKIHPEILQQKATEDDPIKFKFITAGNSFVGKSSFVVRAVDNEYQDLHRATINANFKTFHTVVVNPISFPSQILPSPGIEAHAGLDNVDVDPTKHVANREEQCDKRSSFPIQCHLWDLAGSERFLPYTSTYYRNAHGVWIMYDVCNRESFDMVKSWMGELDRYAPEDIRIVLVGTKVDIDKDEHSQKNGKVEHDDGYTKSARRMVTFEEGVALAQELHIPAFIEISSKDNYQVQDALSTMICLVLKHYLIHGQQQQPIPVVQRNQQDLHSQSNCILL